ncbi:MAG: hypothetical protein J5490_04465 [Bacteroidales bacterium]|jgi:hypothetical protein|nr:hypothetical protein [Bacteroidales bacterium]
MKKILEVLQYGDLDIRFNTDFDVMKNPQALEDLVPKIAMAMTTTLWGGNEMSVLAMIRSLCIADIGVSVNRKEMIEMLDHATEHLAQAMRDAHEAMARSGITVQTFGPGVPPPKRPN